jgi:polyketide biosynthesis acyl carrier protein
LSTEYQLSPLGTPAIFDLIVACTREVIPELLTHKFDRTDRLADLGANSIDRAEIVTRVLEALSLRISRVETFGPNNIGDLVELLSAKMQAH